MSFLPVYRRAARQVRDLLGSIEFPPPGNQVEKRTRFGSCGRPVLLVNGFLSTRRALDVLERRLRRDGHCVFSVNLGGLYGQYNTRSIDALAEVIRGKVDRLYERHPHLGPLSIVGHSKGGLIGAWYVKKLDGWRRTRALVTLGTPHRGTPMAWLAAPFTAVAPSARQMIPRSRFIRQLGSGPWPEQVRLTSIWSREDLLAPAPWSLVDGGDNPLVRNVEVKAMHRQFLVSARVYAAIAAELGVEPVRADLRGASGLAARAAAPGREQRFAEELAAAARAALV